jgi:hypothetical protein
MHDTSCLIYFNFTTHILLKGIYIEFLLTLNPDEIQWANITGRSYVLNLGLNPQDF